MTNATKLVPCPLCGADNGYSIDFGADANRRALLCWHCGVEVTQVNTEATDADTRIAADAAWNTSGAHAQGPRDEISVLKRAAQERGLQTLSDFGQMEELLAEKDSKIAEMRSALMSVHALDMAGAIFFGQGYGIQFDLAMAQVNNALTSICQEKAGL